MRARRMRTRRWLMSEDVSELGLFSVWVMSEYKSSKKTLQWFWEGYLFTKAKIGLAGCVCV